MTKFALENMSFEHAIKELNKIIEKMEQGDLPLEQALEKFEHGIKITRHCQTTLKNAEQQVKILTDDKTLDSFDKDTH